MPERPKDPRETAVQAQNRQAAEMLSRAADAEDLKKSLRYLERATDHLLRAVRLQDERIAALSAHTRDLDARTIGSMRIG